MQEAVDPSDPLAGTPYRIRSCIGRGGMGTVYEVEHETLGKLAVVKLLSDEVAGDDDLVQRMRVEGRILARLNHAHVVAVQDFGWTPGGRPFMVMERLNGRTLGAELRARGPLPVLEALQYVCEALDGLGAAHAVGVVHRDVKLDNFFLHEERATGKKVLKVLDFGVAKLLPDAGAQGIPKLSLPTTEGMLLGTPKYIAPEQLRSGTVDARTDVYGMGLVLYSLLAGRGPWEGLSSVRDILRAQRETPAPPPSSMASVAIPAELDEAVLKAIAKKPEERFQSASEFRDVLLHVMSDLRAPVGFLLTTVFDQAVPPNSSAHRGASPALARREAQQEQPGETHQRSAKEPVSADALSSRGAPRARASSLIIVVVTALIVAIAVALLPNLLR